MFTRRSSSLVRLGQSSGFRSKQPSNGSFSRRLLHDDAQTQSQHSHGRMHAKREPSRIKTSHGLAAGLTTAVACYTVGSLYPPELATFISPRAAPGPPDPSLPSSVEYVNKLEKQLNELPIVHSLRSAPDADEWYETRPYSNYPEEARVNSLTAGALRGPGRLALSPLFRVRKDEKEAVGILHFGRGLCGHDGIIHGGLIATVLDESLGRLAIMNLPDKIGVTATLTIDYKAPTRADQFVVIRTRLVEQNGRKVQVEGTIEDLHGTLLAKGRALFVQPKYAKLLNTERIHKAMGERPNAPIVAGTPVPIPPTEIEGEKVRSNLL